MSTPDTSGERPATLSELIAEADHVAGPRIAEFGRLATAVQQQRHADRASNTTRITRSTALWTLMQADNEIADMFAKSGLDQAELGKLLSISSLRSGPAARETALHPDFTRAVQAYLTEFTEQRPVELRDIAAAIVRDAEHTRGGLLPGRLERLAVDYAAIDRQLDTLTQTKTPGFSDDLRRVSEVVFAGWGHGVAVIDN